MYFDKRRYIIPIVGGTGVKNTESLRGMVVHMIVRPENPETIWSLTIYDKEDDELLEVVDHSGRLDDRNGLPLGKDAQEIITLKFFNVTTKDPIKVIFKTKEME